VSDVNSCVSVRFLKPSDIPLLVAAFDAQGWRKPTSLFDAYVQESTQGARTALAALWGDIVVGYVTIKWHPTYAPFQEKRIPEISDLNVLKVYHRKGIASALMEAAETLVFQTYQCVGLGVGLLSDYGPAQRLYIKRGYKPDGMGLTYQETLCRHGDRVTADDDLLLWCVKEKI
jgi:GNAT superfamily N-acetyltransferase